MRERPILFSGPMVRAILEGRKTQTRRVAKFVPLEAGVSLGFSGLSSGEFMTGVPSSGAVLYSRGRGGVWQQRTQPLHCPFGAPGDRLWVRETWHHWPEERAGDYGEILAAPEHFEYRADGEAPGLKWRPSIHMPRWASRIALEVTDVRVERLQSISQDDAVAEGVESNVDDGVTYYGPLNHGHIDPRVAFQQIWLDIHGEGSWAANPWVWVVSFRRLP